MFMIYNFSAWIYWFDHLPIVLDYSFARRFWILFKELRNYMNLLDPQELWGDVVERILLTITLLPVQCHPNED